MNYYMYIIILVKCARIQFLFSVDLEPTCIFSLLYTPLKISLISCPYQCLFVPLAQKGMGREKIFKIQGYFLTDYSEYFRIFTPF